MSAPVPEQPPFDIPDTAITAEPDPAEDAKGYPAGGVPLPDPGQVQTPDYPAGGVPLPDPGQLQELAGPIVQETRRSWKTSEFWASLAIIIGDIVTNIPTKDKLLVTILGGAYAIARGVAKNGVPNIVPPEAPKE